ncbi:MAG TPA: DEAD/DEAH box helicase [Acidimicrobiales bacterium]|nr:DEAD/DEAH box helicase [Acidimicrobiales bacterium]
MARTIRLRPWQKEALERFRTKVADSVGADGGADFLAVATPGAGKTTFALTAALHWLADQPDARLVVVAPTQHLKRQWAQNAGEFDLALEPFWKPGDALPADMDGIVTTYQQVASNPVALAQVAHRGFVILDEVHHAGDDRAWGDGLRVAFSGAEARLSLSGTPFRSDTNPIPFVSYEWEEAVPDYEYGYGDALGDGGVVRPVHFPRIKGHMEWVGADGQFHSHDFDDDLDRARANQRLRTALSAEGQWMASVLEDAHRRLLEVRRTQPDAGGLVICIDVEHARAIADLIERRWRVRPTVATSDDPMASARIARYAKSDDPWIVAVRMVSEGVDIPRLRVGVFATNTTTELFFRQALGRLVRWTRGLRTQRAWMYIPDDPRLRRLAEGIAEQRRHSLFKRRRPEDEDGFDSADDAAALDDVGDDEQLSLFQAMSAVATGVEGADDVDDAASPEELVWEPDDEDASLEIHLPARPRRRPLGVAAGAHASLAEAKSKLRKDNAALVAHLVAVTGRSHREINGELNRLAGVRKVTEATADQLQRRLVAGERWAKTL